MKFLTICILLFSFNLFAEDKEADLNLPVSNEPQIQKQEEKIPPTIDEVEMKQKDEKNKKQKEKNDTRVGPSAY